MSTLTNARSDMTSTSTAGTSAAGRSRRSPLRWAYLALLAVATVAAIAITVIPYVIQHSGNKLVTITSGSMTPLYPVGSTITIDPSIDRDTLTAGQIITFTALSGTTITHRIVERIERPGLTGVWYQTKGDANRTADADLAPAANIIGLSLGELPWWQQLAVQGQTPKGRLIVFGGLFLLVALGEGIELIRGMRRKDDVTAVDDASSGVTS